NNVSLTLSDGAAAALPDSGQIVSGTFKPTNIGTGDTFPAPAPGGPYGATLSVFNGVSANGVWSLFVVDDAAVDQGAFSGGWTLTITTVGGAPAAPTISDIPDQATTVNTATAAVPFTVNDADTPATSLTLSGSSSNPTLVPNGNIVFGGAGTSRTVTVTPAANQKGTATITVTVSDGQLSASDSFVLTVNAVNDPPTISNIADQSTAPGTTVGPIGFTVGDVETAPGSLILSGTSSNPTLVPDGNIVFGGSGTSRTVTVTPAANQTGTATIIVTVSDGTLTASDTFVLTVNEGDQAPPNSNIADQTIDEDTATGTFSLTVGDVETAAGNLTLSGSSSNPTLVPNGNIVFGGSGSSRTVTVTPAANQTGTATITVTVSDGVNNASDTFVLTVNQPAQNLPDLIIWGPSVS